MNSYNHDLVGDMIATGDAGTREMNDELYPLVVAGDADAIKRMIEGNMSLVIDKVDTYIALHPQVVHIQDDIISEGFVGLCKAVNKMSKQGLREHANPTACMSYWIHDSIGWIVDKESGTVSRFTQARKRKKSKKLGSEIRGDEEYQHQVPMPREGIVDRVVDPTAMIEARDLIYSCCESEIDLAIIRLREKGNNPDSDSDIGTSVSAHPAMSYKEIAQVLGMPVTTVFVLCREVYDRWTKKAGRQGEP